MPPLYIVGGGMKNQTHSRLYHMYVSVGVPMPPGKSWSSFPKITRTRKVLDNEFGPGKSWKLKV